MISPGLLKTLKDLRAKVPQGQVVVTQLDARGTNHQLSTAGQGAVAIGFFRNRANADYAAAAWEWLPKLIDELVPPDRAYVGISPAVTIADSSPTIPTGYTTKKRIGRQPRVRKRAPVE